MKCRVWELIQGQIYHRRKPTDVSYRIQFERPEELRDHAGNSTESPWEKKELIYTLISWKETVLYNTNSNNISISNGDCTCKRREQMTMRKIGPHLMIPLSTNDMTVVLDITYWLWGQLVCCSWDVSNKSLFVTSLVSPQCTLQSHIHLKCSLPSPFHWICDTLFCNAEHSFRKGVWSEFMQFLSSEIILILK